jgi:hypothetical protein
VVPEYEMKQFQQKHKDTKDVLKAILTEIKKTTDPKQGMAWLEKLYNTIFSKLVKLRKDFEFDKDLKARVARLMRYLFVCAKNIKTTIEHQQNNQQQYLLRLFPVKMLEAVLFQQPEEGEIVVGDSFAKLMLKEVKVENKTKQELRQRYMDPNDPRTIQYLKLTEYAMTEEVGKQWKYFVLWLDRQQEEEPQQQKGKKQKTSQKSVQKLSLKEQFAAMIKILGHFDILPLWINTEFPAAYEKQPKQQQFQMEESQQSEIEDPTVATQKMFESFSGAREMMKALQKIKVKMREIDLNLLEDPKYFGHDPKVMGGVWQRFKDELLNFFISTEKDQFLSLFGSTNNLGKMIAFQMMSDFVDKFDKGIKSVTGSQKYKVVESEDDSELETTKNKIYVFREMVIQLVKLNSSTENFNAYLQKTSPIGNKHLKTADDFNFEEDITVKSISFYNGKKKSKDEYLSIEEIFTFTHQYLIEQLSAKIILYSKKIYFPQIIKNIEEKFKLIKNNSDIRLPYKNIDYEKLSYKDYEFIFHYNWKIFEHSAKILLIYDIKNKNQIKIRMIIFGENYKYRWEHIVQFIELIPSFTTMSIKNIEHTSNGVDFTLSVTDISKLMFCITYSVYQSFWCLYANNIDNVAKYLSKNISERNLAMDINNIIAYKLLKLSPEDEINLVKHIIHISNAGKRINSFIFLALEKLPKKEEHKHEWEQLISIVEKLLKSDNQYSFYSQLFLFNLINSGGNQGYPMSADLSLTYEFNNKTTTIERFHSFLKENKNNVDSIIKNALQSCSLLGEEYYNTKKQALEKFEGQFKADLLKRFNPDTYRNIYVDAILSYLKQVKDLNLFTPELSKRYEEILKKRSGSVKK